MTGDQSIFFSLEPYVGGIVTFGDNMNREIIARNNVGKSSSQALGNVFLVDKLQHNLLSISQICDKDNKVIFPSNNCKITRCDNGKVILVGTRMGNTYCVCLDDIPRTSLTCLNVIDEDPLLWHKRFGHASFSLIEN